MAGGTDGLANTLVALKAASAGILRMERLKRNQRR
jgi:hypothetical protein